MRSACVFELLAALLIAPAALAAPASTDPLAQIEDAQQRIFESAAPSVVFLSGKDGFGSGFFVGDGLVLTNAHVVEGADAVDVVLHDGRRFSGAVVERAAGGLDLALVEVAAKGIRALPLSAGEGLGVGSWVAAVGHGRGGVWTFNTGMVSNIYPGDSGRPILQTQIPLNPGNSGGPVLDRSGRVVGIVTAGLMDSNAINFAIRSDVAIRGLDRLSSRCACLVISAPDGVPVFVNGAMAGKGPRLVMPAEARTYDVFAVVDGNMIRRSVTFPAQRRVALEAAPKKK